MDERTPEWFRTPIAEGCHRMMAAGLKFAPVDTIKEAVEAWADGLWRAWPHFQHAPEEHTRIRKTFDRITGSLSEWPAPAVFLDLYQSQRAADERAGQGALPPPPPMTEAEKKSAAAARERFFEGLRKRPWDRAGQMVAAAAKGLRKMSEDQP